MHLVFYDGQCGLCDHVVQYLLKVDKKKQFLFAPLQGTTAHLVLRNLSDIEKKEDTLILVENYQTSNEHIYILGTAVFRICWYLGGIWTLFGLFSFLPGFLYNWIYRMVAKRRHFLFTKKCILPQSDFKNRFLP